MKSHVSLKRYSSKRNSQSLVSFPNQNYNMKVNYISHVILLPSYLYRQYTKSLIYRQCSCLFNTHGKENTALASAGLWLAFLSCSLNATQWPKRDYLLKILLQSKQIFPSFQKFSKDLYLLGNLIDSKHHLLVKRRNNFVLLFNLHLIFLPSKSYCFQLSFEILFKEYICTVNSVQVIRK